MLKVLGAALAAVMFAAPAGATVYKVEAEATISYFTQWGRIGIEGFSNFQDTTIGVGDELLLNVRFTPTMPYDVDYGYITSTIGNSYPFNHGFDHVFVPADADFNHGNFTIQISAYGQPTNETVTVDNIEFSSSAVPELSTWALMLLGAAAISAATTVRRRVSLHWCP